MNPPETGFDPLESERALIELRPRMSALPKERLRRVAVNPRKAALHVLGTLLRLHRYEPALAAAGITAEILGALRTCALAAYEADTVWAGLKRPATSLKPLYLEVRDLRTRLTTVVTALAELGLTDGAVLSRLRGGKAYDAAARDVAALVAALEETARRHARGQPVKDRELTQARQASVALAEGWAKRVLTKKQASAAAMERKQAYSLLVEEFDRVRAAVEYVRSDHGDARTLAPSIFAGMGGRPKRRNGAPPAP